MRGSWWSLIENGYKLINSIPRAASRLTVPLTKTNLNLAIVSLNRTRFSGLNYQITNSFATTSFQQLNNKSSSNSSKSGRDFGGNKQVDKNQARGSSKRPSSPSLNFFANRQTSKTKALNKHTPFRGNRNSSKSNKKSRASSPYQSSSSSSSSSRKSPSKSIKSGKMSVEEVKHDKDKQEFRMDLGDNLKAWIEYRPLGGNKIEMYHTEVPVELRNRGIARALAKGSLERCKAENLRVKVTCSYLINYLDKFAEPNLKILVEK